MNEGVDQGSGESCRESQFEPVFAVHARHHVGPCPTLEQLIQLTNPKRPIGHFVLRHLAECNRCRELLLEAGAPGPVETGRNKKARSRRHSAS